MGERLEAGLLFGLKRLEETDAFGNDFYEILFVFDWVWRRHRADAAEIGGGGGFSVLTAKELRGNTAAVEWQKSKVAWTMKQMGSELSNCSWALLFEEKEPSLEEVKDAFDVFDENKDGFIDALELQRVLCILGMKEGFQLENCKKMIKTFDENGDGSIDFKEFVKFMESSFVES
ncbi:hypothetical protein WN944_020358 [Citrus x changshan-huyou]|uniref:EF-hand domain-containing protein n=1 Tax=Citrus x changshan-huyou TaxID=2935761 RepID=A0AAP0LXQ1_9ROSI